MKNKKWITILVLVIGLIFTANIFVVGAYEDSQIIEQSQAINCKVKYINSQNPDGKDLLNFVDSGNQTIIVKNDGGYRFGVPGEYHVTYGIQGTDIEKTFTITVVESKGTLVDMEIIGGNTLLVDTGDFDIIEEWVTKNVKAKCKILTPSGEYQYIESGLVNARGGAGGNEDCMVGSYTSDLAMPGYFYSDGDAFDENGNLVLKGIRSADNVRYFNPTNSIDGLVEVDANYWLVDKDVMQNTVLNDDKLGVKLEGELPAIEDFTYSLICNKDNTISAKMMNTDKFQAYRISITEEVFDNPPVPKGNYKITIKIPDTLDKDKIAAYHIAFDGIKKEIAYKVVGDYVECSVETLPTTIVLAQDKQASDTTTPEITTKPTILEGENSVWKQGSNESLVIRSSADFETFKGVSVDGKMIDASNYTVKKGSIIVALQPAYLSTLANGKHTVTILSSQGNVAANFEVSQINIDTSKNTFTTNEKNERQPVQTSNKNKKTVNTGDHTDIEMITIIGVVSAICGLKIYKRKDA